MLAKALARMTFLLIGERDSGSATRLSMAGGDSTKSHQPRRLLTTIFQKLLPKRAPTYSYAAPLSEKRLFLRRCGEGIRSQGHLEISDI